MCAMITTTLTRIPRTPSASKTSIVLTAVRRVEMFPLQGPPKQQAASSLVESHRPVDLKLVCWFCDADAVAILQTAEFLSKHRNQLPRHIFWMDSRPQHFWPYGTYVLAPPKMIVVDHLNISENFNMRPNQSATDLNVWSLY
jgi:hypothetical protein